MCLPTSVCSSWADAAHLVWRIESPPCDAWIAYCLGVVDAGSICVCAVFLCGDFGDVGGGGDWEDEVCQTEIAAGSDADCCGQLEDLDSGAVGEFLGRPAAIESALC